MSHSLRCLLCGARDLQALYNLSEFQIRGLWGLAGKAFPRPLFSRKLSTRQISLYSCRACRFRFFDPRLPGSKDFYQALDSRGAYYSDQRVEYPRTVSFAQRFNLKRVLDVGCGAGAFLDLARKGGCITFGTEINAHALRRAKTKGHEIIKGPVHQWDKRYHSSFDLITLFQVLEHVADPIGFIKELMPFLKPQGFFAIAVPNRRGVLGLTPWEPANWPPHHISHWSLPDLNTLSEKTNLFLFEKGSDPLVAFTLNQVLKNQKAQAAFLGKFYFLPDFLIVFISFFYRFTGARHLPFFHGHSIYGFFQKPLR